MSTLMKTTSFSRLALAIALAGALASAAAQDAPKGRRAANRLTPRSTSPAKACCACCRPTPSPNIRSIRRTASSPIRRPPARWRSTTNPASRARRCSTPPMSPRTRAPTGRSLSCSTADRARPPPFCISAWSARASSISGRTGATPRPRNCATIPTPGSRFTDLVLIDPIGTGWSRTVKPDDAKHFWSIAQRRRVVRQGDRALRRQEQPLRLAEISVRRKLWRLPRRQGGARAATRPGHPDFRHRHAVADAGRLAHFRRRRIGAARGVAIAVAGGGRARAQERLQPAALADAEKFAMTDYLMTLAGAPPQGDAAQGVLSDAWRN